MYINLVPRLLEQGEEEEEEEEEEESLVSTASGSGLRNNPRGQDLTL